MKSIQVVRHGGPEGLEERNVPDPVAGPNEVIVQLKAAALNHVDVWVRTGSPAYPVDLPHTPGADGSGVVESIGSDVEGVAVGDRVVIVPGISCGACQPCTDGRDNQCDQFEILGTRRAGTYAERIAVPDQNVMPLPDHISFEDAAAFPLSHLTAFHMVVGRAHVKNGERVLVQGAGSGVGAAAIQIAKWKGAEILAATSSAGKAERIKSLGAGRVHTPETGPLSEWVMQATDGRGVDVVIEHLGPATWEESLRSLARSGRLATCGATTGAEVQMDLRTVFSRNISILGCRMGTVREMQLVADLVFDGKIRPVIDAVYPLEDAVEAHRRLEKRDHVGKIVLKIE